MYICNRTFTGSIFAVPTTILYATACISLTRPGAACADGWRRCRFWARTHFKGAGCSTSIWC